MFGHVWILLLLIINLHMRYSVSQKELLLHIVCYMDVYGHVYNLDILLHVSSNMLPPTTVTISSSGLSPVTCPEQEQQGKNNIQE
jgi:hypothetical protein